MAPPMRSFCFALVACVATAQDYEPVREDINKAIDVNLEVIAPALIRLAWHSAGTYSATGIPHGGTSGATMRFEPEASYEDNRGLNVAIDALQVVKDLHPGISYSDLWVLAGYVAVERLGGPVIEFEGGRLDAPNGSSCPPENRLPMWDENATEIQNIFYRIGMNDRELVALMGAHTVGHTYPENSGFPYMKWDNTPTKFDKNYYSFLFNQAWQFEDEGTRKYYRNRSWIMLLSDFILKEVPELKAVAEEYAGDEELWHKDFAAAFKKLTDLGLNDGCPTFHEPLAKLKKSCPFASHRPGESLPPGHPQVVAV